MGATPLWSSFSILEVRLSGPAALPRFSFESCFDTQFTVIFMFCMDGDMSLHERISSARCSSFYGTSSAISVLKPCIPVCFLVKLDRPLLLLVPT